MLWGWACSLAQLSLRVELACGNNEMNLEPRVLVGDDGVIQVAVVVQHHDEAIARQEAHLRSAKDMNEY